MNLCELVYFTPWQGFIGGSTFFLRACDLTEMMAVEYCHYDELYFLLTT